MAINIAIVVLTADSLPLAKAIKTTLYGARIHGYSKRITDIDQMFTDVVPHLRDLFRSGTTIVGICSSGILVRALAPLINNKNNEPPVVAVAEDGSVSVPLLGGHHGANTLSRKIANAIGGTAAITTAGDLRLGIALDEVPSGWRIGNPDLVKPMTAAFLAGEKVHLESGPFDMPWLKNAPFATKGKWRILATDRRGKSNQHTLVFHPPVFTLGVGCERGVEPEELSALALSTLSDAGLAVESVACVASLDLKADEPAVLALARQLGIPAQFYAAAELEAEASRLANPSEIVFNVVGCHGVAEGAALRAAGADGDLVVPKTRSKKSTCAIARAQSPLDSNTLVGYPAGNLYVVGIGPGEVGWRSPDATNALDSAEVVVGYKFYLDQIADEISGKDRHESKLGEEIGRTRHALELAATGKRVALVSSGDAGIYALASLVFELIDQSCKESWNQISIEVIPGISALQAAAARVGAPLGHDFCAVSLSNLLTPETTIVKRLEAAAKGDFVVALYNPQSKRRRQMLATACRILAAARPADTPVIVAHNLGRDKEDVVITTFEAIDIEKIDMTTLVLVGSSSTRTLRHGGRIWAYTPRGYAQKSSSSYTTYKKTGGARTH